MGIRRLLNGATSGLARDLPNMGIGILRQSQPKDRLVTQPPTRYSAGFFAQNIRSSTPSALHVLGRISEVYKPSSVVDFGCGSGAWLAGAEALGATHLRGFDGPWVDPRALTSSTIEFTPMDFEKELPEVTQHYDLAISVEVAEHLTRPRAEALIERLASAADVIVFSAAVPMQGGTHHINENPQSYWIDLFDRAGFDVFDVFRPRPVGCRARSAGGSARTPSCSSAADPPP